MAINAALRNLEKIAITKSVKEILFDGYSDLLLKLAVELNYTKIPFEKFAWFYEVNIQNFLFLNEINKNIHVVLYCYSVIILPLMMELSTCLPDQVASMT